MEVSAIKHMGAAGVHGRSPLLRLQSDERLVAMTRRGNQHAFEALVARYEARLLAFCRHMLGSKEDAEEVRQELGEVAEGLMRTSAPVRRHLRSCERCQAFRKQLRQTNKALAALFP